MNENITLTADEEKEFTALNLFAYSVRRDELRQQDTQAACWLCMSEEARDECRQKALEYLNAKGHSYNLETLAGLAERALGNQVSHWRDDELHLKTCREVDHNPRAFFYPDN